MKVKIMLLALLAFLVVALYTSCPTAPAGSSSSSSSSAPYVQPTYISIVDVISPGMTDYTFSPSTYYVPVGGTVYWTNMSIKNHDVSNTNGETFAAGKGSITNCTNTPGVLYGYSHLFTLVGTNKYVCQQHIIAHPTMSGIIFVTN